MEGIFKFEDDLLKHYVRVKGWLPLCRSRQQHLQKRKPKLRRRLRYFTFCAVNAVDVFMLEIAKVIHRSPTKRFDTVWFFDRTPDLVAQTQERIPGAYGFAGSFVETVLAPETAGDPLAAPIDDLNTREVHHVQRIRLAKQVFVGSFPFDVLNLDLEDIIFKANDEFPGRVLNALRRVFEWQRRPLHLPKRGPESLDGFTLLFTTRVGPPQLRADYATMVTDELTRNMQRDGALTDLLAERAGTTDVQQVRTADLTAFFELGVPKVLASLLREQDWYIQPDPGVLVFRFTRPGNPPYDILHFAMNVARQAPPIEQRAPGTTPQVVLNAYAEVARQVFQQPSTVVADATVTGIELSPTLDEIKQRRKQHYPDEMGP